MKLPRLQLHLSTLLIVSLLATGLVYLNVSVRESDLEYQEYSGQVAPGFMFHHGILASRQERGWPFVFEVCFPKAEGENAKCDWPALTLNAMACVLLLALSGVAIEWLTRRMKRGAP